MTHWYERTITNAICVTMDKDSPAVSSKRFPSGIGAIWSQQADTTALCEAVIHAAKTEPLALVIIWFSSQRHRGQDIVDGLSSKDVSLNYCGCSTSGEITPDGMQTDGFLAITLPAQWFHCKTVIMADIANMGMETVARNTKQARTHFLQSLDEPADPGSLFAINLIDGLSYSEEPVTVAIDRGLDGIALIGGSAGDDLQFEKTWQLGGGECHTKASVLTLIHCRLPCRVYTNNNFVPTDHKLVVTEADPDRRKVSEFNAEPAALAYAKAIELQPEELDAGSFASYSVIVRFGGQYYCRSIQKLNEDGSMTFFCAIDNGLVLTVARSVGMVASTREKIEAIEAEIGPLEVLLGFDCVYRKLDAQHRQTTHRIAELYQEKNFLGFNTYGEQYGAMHVNQTFTGVAIGVPPEQEAIH